MHYKGTILALTVAGAALGIGASIAPGQSGRTAAAPGISVRFALGGNAARVPATMVHNLVFLPAGLNDGPPSLFELDSTAAVSGLAGSRAADLHLSPDHGAAENGGLAQGDISNAVLSFPGVDISWPALAIAARNDFAAAVGEEYQGTIGDDVLAHLVVAIDYQRDGVQVYDPASYHPASTSVALPLSFGGGVPVVHARFRMENGKSAEGDFAVDTALDASIVFTNSFAQRHRIFSARVKSVSTIDPEVSASERVALARMKDLEIGKESLDDSIAEFPQRGWNAPGGTNLAGAIGGGVWHRFTMTFDFTHHQLYLEPNAHFKDFDQEDKSGLALVAKGSNLKTFEVVDVGAGSPAAGAGIQTGDVIAGVDEEPAANMTLAAVRELLREVGYKRKLEMERNGNPYEVTLDLRRLL